jgi:hypothetical protein
MWIEWFGTLASVVVAVSLTMKNIKRLRTLNLAGSLAFALYGFLISAWPVFGLNAFIVVVNVYYLIRMRREEMRSETFDVLFVDPSRDEYVRRFVETHLGDIRRFFPSFSMGVAHDVAQRDKARPEVDPGTLAGAEACFILREALPVSLVAFRRAAGGEIELLLDYAVPAYRDYKSARFFFDIAAARLIAAAPRSGQASALVFTAVSEVPAHTAYLLKMGFLEETERGRFRKDVPAAP